MPQKRQLLKLKMFYEDLLKDVLERILLTNKSNNVNQFRDQFKILKFDSD